MNHDFIDMTLVYYLTSHIVIVVFHKQLPAVGNQRTELRVFGRGFVYKGTTCKLGIVHFRIVCIQIGQTVADSSFIQRLHC